MRIDDIGLIAQLRHTVDRIKKGRVSQRLITLLERAADRLDELIEEQDRMNDEKKRGRD